MYNGEFKNDMDKLNKIAQYLGYVNGVDWAKTAVQSGQITLADLADLETSHHLRNDLSHGGADEIIISEKRFKFVREYILPIIQQAGSNQEGALVSRPVSEAKITTKEEIEEWCQKGQAHYDNKEYKEAVTWYRKAAEQGNPRGQNGLGVCYYNGTGVPKNLEEAAKWFRKSAEQQDPRGQCNLGVCYELGKGVPKNLEEAVKWYRKSAEQGYPRGQYNLGICYDYGIGVPKNLEEAVKWYRKSAEQGYPRGQCNLGVCYEYGTGVPKDHKEATNWYLKAAEQGYGRAAFYLSECYKTGIGVRSDSQEWMKWLCKSAEQEYPRAQHALSIALSSHDIEKSMYWLQRAAANGHLNAQFDLGCAYYAGNLHSLRNVVEKNLPEAKYWFLRARIGGHPHAEQMYKKISNLW